MKFRCIVEYEYPVEHKPPVKAEIVLHGDKVEADIMPDGAWIPTAKRLPEKGQTVIAFDKYRNKIYINTLSSDGVTWRKYTNNVTAWMPLPEPPKGKVMTGWMN